MKKRIFRNTFIAALVLVIVTMAMMTITVYTMLDHQIIDELDRDMELLVAGVNLEGIDYLNDIDVKKRRIMLIDEDGSILFDTSKRKNREQDFSTNPDFISAVETGESWQYEYASKWSVQRVIHAQKLPDGSVLRITARKDSIFTMFLNLRFSFLLLFLIAVLFSALLSRHTAKSIVTPLNTLNLTDPLANESYEEIRPLLEQIAEQRKNLRASMENRMQEALERHTEFNSAVSHEMRTPLTSIRGFAELMRDEEISSDLIREYAGIIYDEANRLLVLQKNLMDLMMMEDENTRYEYSESDLYELGEQVLEALELRAKHLQVKLFLSGSSAKVIGVEEILYEMVMNLCDNAVKYNRKGGRVDVTAGLTEERPFITVRDTGIGIPEEEIEYIFDRFYRVDRSRSRAVEGNGLGLSILKMGASLHHAEIEVNSKDGEGTVITLLFPKQNPGQMLHLY